MADSGDVVAGRYVLQEPIGSGGMGIVWRAKDKKLEREVAVKCARMDDERSARRLRTEARNAARLHHPHIVTVFDFLDEGPMCWLVMEYVPSRSLAEMITDKRPLTPEQVASIGWQIADALANSHANGVVHGDVTPENILLTEGSIAKLTDFGISRALWSDVTQSRTGGIPGKPRYLPPEVARGREAGRESDMFSLGATLFAAVEGHSPYGEADHPMTYISRAMSGAIEQPGRAGRLAPTLTKLLAVEPKERPGAAETRTLLAEVAPPPANVLKLHDDFQRRSRSLFGRTARPRLTLAVAGAVVALAVTAGVVVAMDRSDGGHGSSAGPEPKSPKPGAAGTLGDPRTADPCGLLSTTSVARFGRPSLVTDYGSFERCDILMGPDNDPVADLRLEFATDGMEEGSRVPVTTSGAVKVAKPPLNGDECERNIALADGKQVWITAEKTGSAPPDLCDLATAATDHAVSVLNKGPVPRHPGSLPAKSLGRQDACRLLDATALGKVPGLRRARPEPGIADWSCSWDSAAGKTGVDLRFDRNDGLDADDGRPAVIAGHDSVVQPQEDGDTTCVIQLGYREFTSQDRQEHIELLRMVFRGHGSADTLCSRARTLATAAAGKLPKA